MGQLLALRHQPAVYRRSAANPSFDVRDRVFWLPVMSMPKEWRNALILVQPETLIRWHRRGFRYYWRQEVALEVSRQAADTRWT